MAGGLFSRWWQRWLLVGALGVAVAASYSVSLHGPFVFDDMYAIVERADRRLWRPWYDYLGSRIVPVLTFNINYAVHGLEPAGFRVVNVAVHVLASAVLFGLAHSLARRWLPNQAVLVGSVAVPAPVLAAAVAAGVFALHPVQTQAVTYIVQRLAALVALFYLASLAAYVQYRTVQRGRRWWAAASLAAGVLAMHSKENAITLPVAVVLLEWVFFSQRLQQLWHRRWRLVPWLLLGVIIPFYQLGVVEIFRGERHIQNTQGLLAQVAPQRVAGLTYERSSTAIPFTRREYLLTQFNVIRTYLRLVLLPYDQHLDYDYPVARSLWSGWTLPSLLLEIGVVGGAVFLVRRWRLAGFGILFFFLALMPESSIIVIYDVLYEHRLYLPLFGLSLAAGEGIARAGQALSGRTVRGVSAAGLLVALVAVWLVGLTAATVRRNLVWRDAVAIWADSAVRAPNKARPHNNLGLQLFARAEYDAALREFLRAVEIDADYAEAYNNVGMLYIRQGKLDEAEAALQRALALKRGHYAHAQNNLGAVFLQRGKLREAAGAFRRAIEIDPRYAGALDNLGIVLIRLDELAEAKEVLRRNLGYHPGFATSYNNLGVIYAREGDVPAARSMFEKTLEYDSGNETARRNLQVLGGGSGLQALP